MVDLQVYNPEKPKQPQPITKQKMVELPMLPIAYTDVYAPPQFKNYMQEQFQKYTQPFIYKDYNINLGGLGADHVMAQRVFEDMLPPDDIYTSFLTLKERNVLCDYIRSSFIINQDGEYKNFSGDKNSLNSRLKLLELTPYRPHDLTNNAYKNRPKNMLLYSSCYPIVYSDRKRQCECADKSVILNLRVYNLSQDEYLYYHNLIDLAHKKNIKLTITPSTKTFDGTKSTIIRECKYFEFIRRTICREKICPNFVQSYCYFLCKDCNVNFNNNHINNFVNSCGGDKKMLSQMCLLLLTEGPDYTIYKWGSNQSKSDRNLVKQYSIGFKTCEMWDAVLFQMVITFYVMFKYKFTFLDMHLNNNFYIKAVSQETSDTKAFIKYVVNNMEFFIPNHGYLLMCNTDNHDITDNPTNESKILMEKELENTVDDINKNIFINMKECLQKSSFKSNNFIEPDEKILDKIDKIQRLINGVTAIDDDLFKDIFITHFGNFLNNRIGSVLLVGEESGIVTSGYLPNLKPGDLVVDGRNNTIVMYLVEDASGDKIFVINNNGSTSIINITDIKYFEPSFKIKQTKSFNTPYLTSDNLIESYYL